MILIQKKTHYLYHWLKNFGNLRRHFTHKIPICSETWKWQLYTLIMRHPRATLHLFRCHFPIHCRPPESLKPAYHSPPTINNHQAISLWTQWNIHQAVHIIIYKRPLFHPSKLSRHEKVYHRKLKWLVRSKLHWNLHGQPNLNVFWRSFCRFEIMLIYVEATAKLQSKRMYNSSELI